MLGLRNLRDKAIEIVEKTVFSQARGKSIFLELKSL